MDIGERIKKRREELGMSQTELAEKVGYTSRSSIAKLETNANGMTQSKIIIFAKALKTTPSYLMGWDDGSTEKPEQQTENLTVKEFNDFARYVESFGYYIRLAEDNSGYNIHKDNEHAYFPTEDFKVLVRSSRLTVKALIDNSLELKKN